MTVEAGRVSLAYLVVR